MIEDLKLRGKYGGFLFLADAQRGIPWLKTHQHPELEINLVARGSVTYVIGKSSYTFYQGECVWLFQPSLVYRSFVLAHPRDMTSRSHFVPLGRGRSPRCPKSQARSAVRTPAEPTLHFITCIIE